jgi:hypothetical protein
MAQGVLDMAAEQPVHSGNARDEARRQLAIAFKLVPETVKKVQKLYEHVDAKKKQRERYAAASTSAPASGG